MRLTCSYITRGGRAAPRHPLLVVLGNLFCSRRARWTRGGKVPVAQVETSFFFILQIFAGQLISRATSQLKAGLERAALRSRYLSELASKNRRSLRLPACPAPGVALPHRAQPPPPALRRDARPLPSLRARRSSESTGPSCTRESVRTVSCSAINNHPAVAYRVWRPASTAEQLHHCCTRQRRPPRFGRPRTRRCRVNTPSRYLTHAAARARDPLADDVGGDALAHAEGPGGAGGLGDPRQAGERRRSGRLRKQKSGRAGGVGRIRLRVRHTGPLAPLGGPLRHRQRCLAGLRALRLGRALPWHGLRQVAGASRQRQPRAGLLARRLR